MLNQQQHNVAIDTTYIVTGVKGNIENPMSLLEIAESAAKDKPHSQAFAFAAKCLKHGLCLVPQDPFVKIVSDDQFETIVKVVKSFNVDAYEVDLFETLHGHIVTFNSGLETARMSASKMKLVGEISGDVRWLQLDKDGSISFGVKCSKDIN